MILIMSIMSKSDSQTIQIYYYKAIEYHIIIILNQQANILKLHAVSLPVCKCTVIEGVCTSWHILHVVQVN